MHGIINAFGLTDGVAAQIAAGIITGDHFAATCITSARLSDEAMDGILEKLGGQRWPDPCPWCGVRQVARDSGKCPNCGGGL